MNTWLMGALDRAARSGLQVLAAYLSVVEFVDDVQWLPALSAAGFAVVLSLLTSAISSPSWGEAWLFQVAERAVKTFLQTVLGGIGVATMFAEVDWRTVLSAALLAAVYSVVTSVLATRVGPEPAVGQVDVVPPPVRSAALRRA